MGLNLKGQVVMPPAPPKAVQSIAPPPPTPKVLPDKKEKEKVKAVLNGNLQAIMKAIVKDKGSMVLCRGNQIPKVTRTPTGVFEWDFQLGGGFPNGRYSIIYGPESSGKTNICYLAVAQAQRKAGTNNKAVWVNLEQTFDPVWAAILGVDVEALIVVNPGYGEEAVDIIDALVRAEDVAILVVDSMAALISSKEIAQSTENADVMSSALLTKRMVNKMMIAFSEEAKRCHFPCVLLINQIRYKMTMFGDPEVMPGGVAQLFLASMRVRISAKNIADDKINPNLPIYKETTCIVKKAKVPIIKAKFVFNLVMVEHDGLKPGQSDSWGTVEDYLKTLGYLTKGPKGYEIEGETFIMPGTSTMLPMYWKTLVEIKQRYRTDENFRLRMQGKVIDAFADKAIYVEEEVVPPLPKGVQPGIVSQVVGPQISTGVQSLAEPEEDFALCTHECPSCGLVWDHDATVDCPGDKVSTCPDCASEVQGG
jgi:recombination protein RecA